MSNLEQLPVLALFAVLLVWCGWPFFLLLFDKIIDGDKREDFDSNSSASEEESDLPDANIGRIARTTSILSPAGSIRVGGTRYDAVSGSGYIDPSVDVEIVGVRISQYVVRSLQD